MFSWVLQAVCTATFHIVDVVARWPGATHDARIFRESAPCTRLEQGILDLVFHSFLMLVSISKL